jgi:hypothetical protein
VSYADAGLELCLTHSRGNLLASVLCKECDGTIAPGGVIWDSCKELLANKSQILKIKSPFWWVHRS